MMKLLAYLQKKHQVSRREYKDMLDEHALLVNEHIVDSFDWTIQVGDSITIRLPHNESWQEKVEKISFPPSRIILFNKPKGYVVSKDDPHNKTIYELFPDSWRDDFWYIGRLDKESTGLLILTNDSRMVDEYENPQNNIHKVYQVMIDKPLRSKDKIKANKGIDVTEDGYLPSDDPDSPYETLKCVTIKYTHTSKGKHELIITLNE